MDDMFEISKEDREYWLKNEHEAKEEMIRNFKESDISLTEVITSNLEFCNHSFSGWNELFELDVKGFDYKVIK